MTTTKHLRDLSDEEYEDALEDSVDFTEDFRPFLTPVLITRTEERLRRLIDIIRVDEIRYGGDDPELKRDIFVRRQFLMSRLQEVVRKIAYLDRTAAERKEVADLKRYASAFKDLAHTALVELEKSDRSGALDTIREPFKLTARQWLAIRRAKQPSRA